MNNTGRAYNIEMKLAYIRIAVAVLGVMMYFFMDGGTNVKEVHYLLAIGVLYSTTVLVLLMSLGKYTVTLSKVFEFTDLLLISAVQCFMGIEAYLAQLCLLFIIGAALRFSFKHFVFIVVINIFLILTANQINHSLSKDPMNIARHFQTVFPWLTYVVLISSVLGLIAGELKKERNDNVEKGQKLLDAKALLHKFNLFVRKVNQAEQILFTRDSNIEDFITTVAREVAHITKSERVYLIIFDKYGETSYFIGYPFGIVQNYWESVKNSDKCKSLLRFIISSYPGGLLLNSIDNHPIHAEVTDFIEFGKNAACGTAAMKNGSNIIIFASSDEFAYSEVELSMIQSFCLHIGFALEKKEQNEMLVKKRLMENEIRVTADIQRTLFPESPFSNEKICVAGYNSPSLYISGDYVDYFINSKGRLYNVIADIMGGGLPSGFISLGLRSALRIIAEEEEDSGRILERLNKHLCDSYGELNGFITMYLAVVDFESNKMNYSSAGHFAPLVWAGRKFVRLEDGDGIALGIESVADYNSVEAQIISDVLIVCYTDGVTETQSSSGERFGKERLRQSVEKYFSENKSVDNEALIGKIKEDVIRFSGDGHLRDDWSLLVSYFKQRD